MAADHVILASNLSDSGSRLLGVLEAVGGFLAILILIFFLAGRVTGRFQRPIAIVVCLGPAMILAFVGLVIPAINTIVTSFTNEQSTGQKLAVVNGKLVKAGNTSKFIGLDNYKHDFTDSTTLHTMWRTLQWLIVVPIVAVAVGLLIALLIDRMRYSSFPKTLIFLPTAISFVGASLIFQYLYNYVEPSQPQTGLLSAVAIKLGWSNPPNWLTVSPGNVYLEMIILVWIQAGFAMVVLGAALKAIPDEILEAARMDGATGFRLFRTVQIPMIRSTLVVVLTTISIATLKLYDIVQTLNNGNFNTDVLAHQMYTDLFVTNQVGIGSSLAVILFMCVTPLVIYNVSQLRKERAR